MGENCRIEGEGCGSKACGCGKENCDCGSGSCGCESKSCGCGSEGCGCGQQNCGCGQDGCGCGSGDFYETMQGKLVEMAIVAHKSALFDRIRGRIEKVEGEKLDRIAELVVETALGKYKDAQEAARKSEELRGKLKEIMEA